MVSVKFLQDVAAKGCFGFKGYNQILKDVNGHIAKSITRGMRSPYHKSTEYELGRYWQTFETKNGDIVKKVYTPGYDSGSVETALFKGYKAKIIKQNSYYEEITQPDHLVSSRFSYDKEEPIFSEIRIAVTKPTKQTNEFAIERGIHMPQETKTLHIHSEGGSLSTETTKMGSGRWYGYPFGCGPTTLGLH